MCLFNYSLFTLHIFKLFCKPLKENRSAVVSYLPRDCCSFDTFFDFCFPKKSKFSSSTYDLQNTGGNIIESYSSEHVDVWTNGAFEVKARPRRRF